jgi:hypothetical protein
LTHEFVRKDLRQDFCLVAMIAKLKTPSLERSTGAYHAEE